VVAGDHQDRNFYSDRDDICYFVDYIRLDNQVGGGPRTLTLIVAVHESLKG
jgi:hypothetical protein